MFQINFIFSTTYDPVDDDHEMHACMAGATLSKGLNRGIGTILGGGLGCLAAALAQEVGGIGNAIVVGTSVFIFGKNYIYM